jgi:hypothetical protein
MQEEACCGCLGTNILRRRKGDLKPLEAKSDLANDMNHTGVNTYNSNSHIDPNESKYPLFRE